jgi:hypothetical protein
MDEFYNRDHCERCTGDLTARTLSWFNRETICLTCSNWEDRIIEARRESKSELEARGTVPSVSFEVRWGEQLEDPV